MGLNTMKVVRGSIFRNINLAINIIGGLLLMPFTVHAVGDKDYGLWVLIGTFMGYYGLFDFGLLKAVQRFVSRAIGVNDTKEKNAIINTALYIYLFIGGLIMLVSAIVFLLAPHFIKDSTNLKLFRTIIPLLSLSVAIGLPMRVFKGLLISYFRFDLNAITEIVAHLLRILLTFSFLRKSNGLLILSFIAFTTEMIMHVMTFVFAGRTDKNMIISSRLVDKSRIKSIFNYSGVSAIASITQMMRFRVSSFIIAGFLGLKEVTIYVIALRLVEYFTQAMKSTLGFLLPIFSQYEGKKDYASIRNKYLFLTKISCFLSVLIGATLILFGRNFIGRWMGPEYVVAYMPMVILTVANIFTTMQITSEELLFGISKHKYFIAANCVEAAGNLILSFILIKKFGIIGIALGVSVPVLIMKLFVQPAYVCRAINLKPQKYYLKTVLPVVVKSFIFFSIFWLATKEYALPVYFNLAVAALSGALLFSAAAFFFVFNKDEKQYLLCRYDPAR